MSDKKVRLKTLKQLAEEFNPKPDQLIAKFKLCFGREQLSEIINIEKFDYEVIDNMVYVYKLVKLEPQRFILSTSVKKPSDFKKVYRS